MEWNDTFSLILNYLHWESFHTIKKILNKHLKIFVYKVTYVFFKEWILNVIPTVAVGEG